MTTPTLGGELRWPTMKTAVVMLTLLSLGGAALPCGVHDMDEFGRGLLQTVDSTVATLLTTRCQDYDYEVAWNEYCDHAIPRPCPLDYDRIFYILRCHAALAVHQTRTLAQHLGNTTREAAIARLAQIFGWIEEEECGTSRCRRDSSVCDWSVSRGGVCISAKALCDVKANEQRCLRTAHVYLLKTSLMAFINHTDCNSTIPAAIGSDQRRNASANGSDASQPPSVFGRPTEAPVYSAWLVVPLTMGLVLCVIVIIILAAFAIYYHCKRRRAARRRAEQPRNGETVPMIDRPGQPPGRGTKGTISAVPRAPLPPSSGAAATVGSDNGGRGAGEGSKPNRESVDRPRGPVGED